MNVNLDDGASKILNAIKKEIRERDNSKASYSDVIREMSKWRGKVKQ